MTQEKIKLPPRKWYDLEQASEKLTNDLGKKFTEKDLIYYANQGYLELSVYIDFEFFEEDRKANFEIRNSSLQNSDIVTTQGILISLYRNPSDLYSLIEEPKYMIKGKNYIQGEFFKSIINNKTTRNERLSMLQSLNSLYDDLIEPEIFLDKLMGTTPFKKIKINQESFVIAHFEIEKLKGFFTIDIEDFEAFLIDERNPVFKINEIMFRTARNEKQENTFKCHINLTGFKGENIVTIGKNSIFITEKELENFKEGKQIRSINDFESAIDEIISPTRSINDSTEIIKITDFESERLTMFRLEERQKQKAQNSPEIVEKTIEQTQEKSKKYYERIVLESCMETAKKYPDAGVYSIVSAVIKKIKTDYGVTDRKMFYSERHYVNKLRENGTSPTPQRGKNGKIIEPIIKLS